MKAGCIRVTHPCATLIVILLQLIPFNLHVLCLPLALILSQDQTLHSKRFIWFLASKDLKLYKMVWQVFAISKLQRTLYQFLPFGRYCFFVSLINLRGCKSKRFIKSVKKYFIYFHDPYISQNDSFHISKRGCKGNCFFLFCKKNIFFLFPLQNLSGCKGIFYFLFYKFYFFPLLLFLKGCKANSIFIFYNIFFFAFTFFL